MSKLLEQTETLVNNVQYKTKSLYVDGNDNYYNAYSYGYITKNSNGSYNTNRLEPFTIPDAFTAADNWPLDKCKQIPFIGRVNNQYIAVTDCSGLVSYLVQQANNQAYCDLIDAIKCMRCEFKDLNYFDEKHHIEWPSAADFAVLGSYLQICDDDIRSFREILKRNWSSVAFYCKNCSNSDLYSKFDREENDFPQTGDILAWSGTEKSHDSGHVMIVKECKRGQQLSQPIEVTVYDASADKHENDSRPHDNSRHLLYGEGIGYGGIFLRHNNIGGNSWEISFDKKNFYGAEFISFTRLK